MPYVVVSGPHQATADEEAAGYRAGALLAGGGWTVLTGGLGGVMAATASGVESAGGTAVALLPGVERDEASPGHAVVLPTGLGEMRNALLVRCADALLAIGGSWGTLSEVALAARTGVPAVVVGTDLPAFAGPEVAVAGTVEEAVAWLASRF